jgi:predicted MFS family arabinose efflux permease
VKNSASLLRDRNFVLLWSGQFVSDFGSQVSIFALPIVAVMALHATALQVATLQSIEFATIALVAIIAGALADRHRRKRVMMVSNLVRLLTMLSLPIAFGLGKLTMGQLFICAIICSAASVMFDVAYQAIVPSLVGSERLADGNAKLSMSGSVAEAIGSSAGGAIVQIIGAPLAMIADAACFIVSLYTLARIRHKEEKPQRPDTEEDSRVRAFARETMEGFRQLNREPALRMIVLCTATNYLGGAIVTAVFPVLIYRVMHLPPALFGVVMGIANVGMVGAFVSQPMQKLVGERGALGSAVAISAVGKLMYLASYLSPIGAVALGRLLITFAGPLYEVTQQTYRVAFVPEPLMGRVAAAFRAVTWATLPVGSLMGGILATTIGVQHAIFIGSTISFCSILWLAAFGRKSQAQRMQAAG